jgi:hypothetical protein
MSQHPGRYLRLAFCPAQELLCQVLRHLSLPAVEVKQVESPKHRKELGRVPDLLT